MDVEVGRFRPDSEVFEDPPPWGKPKWVDPTFGSVVQLNPHLVSIVVIEFL